MNPIDRLICKHSNKVRIDVLQSKLTVVFGTLPTEEIIEPLRLLVQSGRFRYDSLTDFRLKRSNLFLVYTLESMNFITPREASDALCSMLVAMGLEVYVYDLNGEKKSISVLSNSGGLRVRGKETDRLNL